MSLGANVTKFLGTQLGGGSVPEGAKGHCLRPKAEFDHSSDQALVGSRISSVSERCNLGVSTNKKLKCAFAGLSRSDPDGFFEIGHRGSSKRYYGKLVR